MDTNHTVIKQLSLNIINSDKLHGSIYKMNFDFKGMYRSRSFLFPKLTRKLYFNFYTFFFDEIIKNTGIFKILKMFEIKFYNFKNLSSTKL